jgi:hypothetical protein
MTTSVWRRLSPGALVLGLALAGLAAVQTEGVAQTSSCGGGGGPLCKEIRTCRPTGGSEWSCGTQYTYYATQIT